MTPEPSKDIVKQALSQLIDKLPTAYWDALYFYNEYVEAYVGGEHYVVHYDDIRYPESE